MTERNPHDFYATPDALCDAALAELGMPWHPSTILDAGAGAGAWGAAARRRWPDADIIGVELRDIPKPAATIAYGNTYDGWYSGVDFLRWRQKPAYGYDLIVMNPPFSLAQAFIEHAHTLTRHIGTAAALLPLGFLGAQERVPFWQRYPPWRICPIAPRPSFTGGGEANSEYAFYIWRLGSRTGQPFKWITWDKPRGKRQPTVAPSCAVQEVLL